MSAKASLTFRGMAPGKCPSVVIEIPLDAEHAALAEHVFGQLFGAALGAAPRGNEPVAPLATRGPVDGDHH